MAVREFPESPDVKIRVNLESLKFMNGFWPVVHELLSLAMTLLSANKLLFMFLPSINLRP